MEKKDEKLAGVVGKVIADSWKMDTEKIKYQSLYPERRNSFGEYFWEDKIKVKQTELLIEILEELKKMKKV